jgi:hypothetical protein
MSKFGESILRACAVAADRRPWLVVLAATILAVLAGYAATGLTINTSTNDILSAELPFRQIESAYEAAFPEDDVAVAVIDAPTAGEADAAGRALAARLAAATDSFEWAELGGASPYFDRYGLMFLPAEQIAAIGERLRPARRLLTLLGNDPSLRGVATLLDMTELGVSEAATPPETGRLLAQLAATVDAQAGGQPADMQWGQMFRSGFGDLGGTRRVVQMKPVLDNTSIDRAGPALEALDAAIAQVEATHPDITVRVTGEPVLRQQELNDAFSGALTASGLSLFLVASILTLGIRSGRTIAALLISLLVGAIWTTGLAAVTVGRLNLISVAFMVLFFGLGIDFGTHLSLRFLEAARSGAPFVDSLKRAMTSEGPSITLSALCAALAFLSFVPTPYVGLAEFGIISALGMLVALVITFTLLPALLSLMRPKPSPRAVQSIGIGPLISRHYRAILIVAGVVSVAAIVLAARAEIDTNPLNLQNPNTESVLTYRDLANDPETSPYALNAIAPSLEEARVLVPKLMALEGVAGVRWVDNFVPQDQAAKLAALEAVRARLGESFFADAALPAPSDAELQAAFAETKASAEAIAATPADVPVDPGIPQAGRQLADALARFAAAKGSDPAALKSLGEALTRQMPPLTADLKAKLSVSAPASIDDIPPDFRREWMTEDGRVRLRVLPIGNIGSAAQMKTFAESVQSIAPDAAGAPASVTGAGKAILLSFAEAIGYTIVAIGIVVIVVRRRLSDVFLVLAPLAVGALWTIAASALLALPFNFANVIVIPLLIGLGVASSIHIVSRAREVAHEGGAVGGHKAEVLDTSTPLAVLITQLNTVAAFATLAVANHRGLFSMGVLLGISIFFVLIVSLVVLPSFMVAVGIGTPKSPGQERG